MPFLACRALIDLPDYLAFVAANQFAANVLEPILWLLDVTVIRPLLVTTKPEMNTVVMGLTKLMPSMDSRPEWNLVMAAAVLALLPPVAVVLVLQRWFVKGLVETDK